MLDLRVLDARLSHEFKVAGLALVARSGGEHVAVEADTSTTNHVFKLFDRQYPHGFAHGLIDSMYIDQIIKDLINKGLRFVFI